MLESLLVLPAVASGAVFSSPMTSMKPYRVDSPKPLRILFVEKESPPKRGFVK
jgi:hypothetical protein